MEIVRRRLPVLVAVAAVLVVVLATALGFCAGRSTDSPAPTATSAVPVAGAKTPVSGLPTVAVAKLPQQARDTLALIDKGGPYPYDRDGIVFGNNERLLPPQNRGYYHEYTVPTPGSRDRGARRLIVGQNGDIYYTDDHYESFRQVLR
ncbi:MAG: ribonuclease N1 [Hamadaea sp.]|uniref:ribonuclease domain-containing protein n=1 Tax=Hamadaea sp. TaxID=2024425 RepID=UPI001846A354|nr:ribonuclease domain-containing protein [Hamadaea sp.]NUR73804.1 ribonuclease N1 [Hamadaea sp.]NUT24288.1 ribonuclease N1 [Hamadaea sp.]